MKVIFLDFEGVLNDWEHFTELVPAKVEQLKKIIDATNAVVVVTSSLSYYLSLCDLPVMVKNWFIDLEKLGIKIYDYVNEVDKINRRYYEILDYLNRHPEIEEYVILDDDYILKEFLDHLVFIEYYTGLLDEHVDAAINILNGNLGLYPKTLDLTLTPYDINIRNNIYNNTKTHKK